MELKKYNVKGVPVPAQANEGLSQPPGEGVAVTSKNKVIL